MMTEKRLLLLLTIPWLTASGMQFAADDSDLDPSFRLSLEASSTFPAQLLKEKDGNDVEGMTSPPSVMQLNVIDRDGNMTSMVYTGKKVALELQSSHHTGGVGVPVVDTCTVTNPLPTTTTATTYRDPGSFSHAFVLHGCGRGDTLARGKGFKASERGYQTPFFAVPSAWAAQTALLVSCRVTLCAQPSLCRQLCPPSHRTPTTPGPHDVTVLLESQILTSCPQGEAYSDRNWGDGRQPATLPECVPEDDSLLHSEPPADSAGNVTADAGGSDAHRHSTTSSWEPGRLHYLLLMVILGLLLVLVTLVTFCKTASLQKQVERCSQLVDDAGRPVTLTRCGQRLSQGTQTLLSLPWLAKGRNRHPSRGCCSSVDGDGELFTVVDVWGGVGSAVSRPQSTSVPAHRQGDPTVQPHPSPPCSPSLNDGGKQTAEDAQTSRMTDEKEEDVRQEGRTAVKTLTMHQQESDITEEDEDCCSAGSCRASRAVDLGSDSLERAVLSVVRSKVTHLPADSDAQDCCTTPAPCSEDSCVSVLHVGDPDLDPDPDHDLSSPAAGVLPYTGGTGEAGSVSTVRYSLRGEATLL